MLELPSPIKVGFESVFSNKIYSIIIKPSPTGFLEKSFENVEKIRLKMRLIIFEDKNVLDLRANNHKQAMFDIRFGKETLLSRFEKINHQNRISLWVK